MGNKKLEIFDSTKGCISAPDLTKDHHQFKLIRADHFLIQLIMPAISNTMWTADYNPVKSFIYFFTQHLVLEHNFPPIMYCVPNRHG
jgi:hypothetical protein